MTTPSFITLIQAAQRHMAKSRDPIHDHEHASRVVDYVKKFEQESSLAVADGQALQIAAWWHDVSRILTKNPSFVLMPLVDDLLSGWMLLWHIIRHGIYEPEALLAVRLIWGKSLGTGAFLKKILLSKKNQLLADLLKDADTLDTFAIERFEQVLLLVDGSRRYEIGYKIVCRWFSLLSHLQMKTEAARKYVLQLLRQLIAWLKRPKIILWHVERFGKRWTNRSLQRIERVFRTMTQEWQTTTA